MNRLILRYGYPITVVILLIFAWVIYQRVSSGSGIRVLVTTAIVVWIIGTAAFVYFWPRMVVTGIKRALVRRGVGGGPIPVNTLYAAPEAPSGEASAAGSGLLGTGTDRLLYVGGWLDLRAGPQVLHVPEMGARYYSVQFTEPAGSTDFAYVGTRATGGSAGDYLITGPRWAAAVPDRMPQLASPSNGVLVIGRVFFADEVDRAAAYALARQITVTPFAR
jgi:hypothetical protein